MGPTTSPVNILALCFVASPTRGSEFSVGWGWLTAISQDHRVWVVTNDSSRAEIEAWLGDGPGLPNVRFVYVPWSTRWAGTLVWPFVRPFLYNRWRKRALAATLDVCRTEAIQLCHYVNGVGFRDVVPLWKSGLPFVWGPVGGLSYVHKGLLPHVDVRARFFYALKNVMRYLSIRFSRLPRQAAREAAAIIAATEQTRRAIRNTWGRDSTVIAEVGAPALADTAAVSHRQTGEPLRIAWSGRIHSGKAPGLALEAVGLLGPEVDWELTFAGDGPDREKLMRRAQHLGVAERCRFPGWLRREEAIGTLSRAHVFVLTSVYDLTSNVFVEALSCGLPVVCLSSQAAATMVERGCGIVVPVEDSGQIVPGIAAALKRLYEDEDIRSRMSAAALETAGVYDWEEKRRAVSSIYEELLAG